MIKITEELAEMLVKIEPEVYEIYFMGEDNEKVIYGQVALSCLKSLYKL
jgi:hypothetical protein